MTLGTEAIVMMNLSTSLMLAAILYAAQGLRFPWPGNAGMRLAALVECGHMWL